MPNYKDRIPLPSGSNPALDRDITELFIFAMELPNSGMFDWNLETEELLFLGAICEELGISRHSHRPLLGGLIPHVVEPHVNWLVEILARVPSFHGLAFFERCIKCRAGSGKFAWLRIRGSIAFTDDTIRRRPIHIRGMMDDVTTLYAKVDQYHAIFESIGEGVVSFDSEWRYVQVNRNAEKLLGRSSEHLIGRVFWEVFPEVLGSPLEKIFRDAMAGVHSYHEHLYQPWNRWFGNYCSKSPLGGVTVVFQDITDKKLAEQARLAAEHKALVEQTSVAAQTVAALAHELNQPLMVLEANTSSLTHLLKDADLKREVRHIILENERQTKRASDIFRDLLGKISSWRHSQRVAVDYDIHALIEACTRGTMTRFPDARIHLELKATRHQAFGDQVKIEKALMNVLANAAESLGPQSVKFPEIYVLTSNTQSKLNIHVSDTGTGVKKEVQAALFTEFASTKTNGLGLGLSIAKSLFEDQGGKIWFHGNLNPGAEFRIQIPLSNE